MCDFGSQCSVFPAVPEARPYFCFLTGDGSWPEGMAALGPTPEFGESIAHGYFLVSPIRARQAGYLIVRVTRLGEVSHAQK